MPVIAARVRHALASIDRSTLIGKRDYALLLLAAETGRGAADLSGLTYDDLTWTDDQEQALISWHVHSRKQLTKVYQEIGPDVALPLREWIRAMMAAGYSEHHYVFVTLSNNLTAGAPMSMQSIRATTKRRMGTARARRPKPKSQPQQAPGPLPRTRSMLCLRGKHWLCPGSCFVGGQFVGGEYIGGRRYQCSCTCHERERR
jgi:integrase